MSNKLTKKSVARNYAFLAVMLGSMVLGSVVGWIFPQVKDAEGTVVQAGATVLKPLGTLFINMMFCIVVPMVFASIAGSIATMKSRKRAGKIMGTTILTFVITGAIAAAIMIVLMKLIPPVLVPWSDLAEGVVDDPISIPDLIVNFFTVGDFSALLSRSAMLPLIVFAILFGFGVNLGPGPDSPVAQLLTSLSDAMMKVVQIVTYYAPIAFFGFFADLVATYGSQITTDYVRALAVYYPLCFIYIFTAFPLFAWFGGGKGAVGEMFRHIARPAITSLGTCSSVATIPTNMEVAEESGISKDVSEIVLPLGATMHMDGSCFSCVLKIAFLFGVFGKPFDNVGDFILIILVAVLSSVGMSGVPGGGYIGEFIMCSVFFPDQLAVAYPIAITIGNLVDPPATMINSAGDYVVSFLVSRFVDGKDWFQKVKAARSVQ
jgi:Na+/H+-dicarboxylate symporter|nr:dicarboxylate/amino acid:cation symporter [uncultured Oscillibacter sp.]